MNVNDKKTIVYSRNTVEFVTVAAEFCAYLEQSEGRKCRDFTDTVLKLLPLLYLKAALLEDIEGAEDFLPEAFVSEQDYEFVRLTLSALLGEKDDYLDFCNEGVKFSDEPAVKTISEDLADIYQALKNFVETYRIGLEENMYEAVAEVRNAFVLYWGQTLTNAMRALHRVRYSPEDDEDEELDVDFQNKMKTLYSKFDKKLISALPRALFEGRIFVIQTEAEASRAVDYLLASAVLGVDTETRPSFRKGCTNKVALLQVSTDDTCFLFRLNHIGVTESVKRLLQDENVLKVGLSLRDDFASLHKRGEFEPRAFLDLQDYVRAFGIEDMSLQKLYANIFGQKISKGQRLTNWEADVLTEGQKLYAATDAWACIRLYRELETLKENNDYELAVVQES